MRLTNSVCQSDVKQHGGKRITDLSTSEKPSHHKQASDEPLSDLHISVMVRDVCIWLVRVHITSLNCHCVAMKLN